MNYSTNLHITPKKVPRHHWVQHIFRPLSISSNIQATIKTLGFSKWVYANKLLCLSLSLNRKLKIKAKKQSVMTRNYRKLQM